MKHLASLFLFLALLWLLLSGKLEFLPIALGVVSCLFVVYTAKRMDVVDHEGHPLHIRFGRLLFYWGWLFKEIAKSNWAVARCILDPKLPISPMLLRVRADQLSDLGKVIYANSITLTPGTVSINVDHSAIEVHALTREGAAALEQGEMARRVMALESPHAPEEQP